MVSSIWSYGNNQFTLWWTNILLWKITIFNGKIHYFDWAIFHCFLYVHQRVIPIYVQKWGDILTIFRPNNKKMVSSPNMSLPNFGSAVATPMLVGSISQRSIYLGPLIILRYPRAGHFVTFPWYPRLWLVLDPLFIWLLNHLNPWSLRKLYRMSLDTLTLFYRHVWWSNHDTHPTFMDFTHYFSWLKTTYWLATSTFFSG